MIGCRLCPNFVPAGAGVTMGESHERDLTSEKVIIKRDPRLKREPRFSLLFEHDLFGKPLHTFPDHAVRHAARFQGEALKAEKPRGFRGAFFASPENYGVKY
jgi:hypothetical protein